VEGVFNHEISQEDDKKKNWYFPLQTTDDLQMELNLFTLSAQVPHKTLLALTQLIDW